MIKLNYQNKIVLFIFFSLFLHMNLLSAGRVPEAEKPLSDFILKQCEIVKSLSVPDKDKSNKMDKTLEHCNAQLLYYGFKSDLTKKKTLHCAIARGDESILMMIYANGYGTKKNLNLALHFACSIDREFFNMETLVNDLISMRDKKSDTKIDLYNYLVFPLADLAMIDLISRIDESEQENYIQNLIHSFTPEEKQLYDKIRASEATYIALHNASEVASRADIRGQEEVKLKREGVVFLKQISSCQTMEYSKKDYLLVDKILNQRYREKLDELKEYHSIEYTNYLVKRLKKTERAWVNNKILWEQLGRLRCPQIDAYTWSTILTRKRAIQLDHSLIP